MAEFLSQDEIDRLLEVDECVSDTLENVMITKKQERLKLIECLSNLTKIDIFQQKNKLLPEFDNEFLTLYSYFLDKLKERDNG